MNTPDSALLSCSTITIHTDGSCINNGCDFAFGGWSAILEYPYEQRRISGRAEPTTSSRMELTAIIEGIRAIHPDWSDSHVIIFTDSQYVANGCSQWRHGWKKKGWRTAQGKPVANLDLWHELDALLEAHCIDVRWVKGHNGEPMNELADRLALAAAHGKLVDRWSQQGDYRDLLESLE
ncbi:ribonuclease HI [Billgrantia desiderata SP1]|uniref:ribonuclease HI n=1 Tax=Billgrantia desiderata TaxID=52021 RepID=UPI000A380DB4|nr:ribonuclease HI [Halomonas desiderata]OUE44479.1 ribonuclease HI [Halomonas desiderata SP1]